MHVLLYATGYICWGYQHNYRMRKEKSPSPTSKYSSKYLHWEVYRKILYLFEKYCYFKCVRASLLLDKSSLSSVASTVCYKKKKCSCGQPCRTNSCETLSTWKNFILSPTQSTVKFAKCLKNQPPLLFSLPPGGTYIRASKHSCSLS